METLVTSHIARSDGPGFGLDAGLDGEGEGLGEGRPLGGGVWSQIGIFGFGVHVGEGIGVGVCGSVGSGLGGTRGSGNRGSAAAASACVRFQSGPYAPVVGAGTGVMNGVCPSEPPFAASTMTRSPIRSPRRMAARRTKTPAARTAVTKRFDESMGRLPFYEPVRGSLIGHAGTTSSFAARARRSVGWPIN
jgi:hypothetical protein